MKIEKTVCPYCGANMKILPGQKQAECEYCGSSVVITGVESETQKESEPHKDPDRLQNRPTENPHPAAQNYEEHKAAAPVRHGIFPPPGFRSRNILHMIIAVCGVHHSCWNEPGKCHRFHLFHCGFVVSR